MAGSRVKDNHVRLASLETLAAAAFFCPVFHLLESSSLFLYVIRERSSLRSESRPTLMDCFLVKKELESKKTLVFNGRTKEN